MTSIDLDGLKSDLADVAGIDELTETIIGGRRVYGFNGLIAAVDMSADSAAIQAAIRNAAAMRPAPFAAARFSTEIGPAPTTQPKGKTMSTPAPGSFAASLRAMIDEAKDKVARAKADGLTAVQDAVNDLADAAVSTTKVAGQMAKGVRDEASNVRAELGQISNDL